MLAQSMTCSPWQCRSAKATLHPDQS